MNRLARFLITLFAALFAAANVVVAQAASSGPSISDQTVTGSMDVPISGRIQATNAVDYWITVGSLPPGVRVDEATGALAGTPTVAGTTTVVVEVTSASGAKASAHLTFVISGTNTQAVITSVSVDPGDHSYGFSLSVTYSRAVWVTLQPVIHVTIGGQPATANFGYPDLSGTNRKIIQFFYTVTGGAHGALAIQSPIDLGNGTIASDDGIPASLTFTPPDTSGVYIGIGSTDTKTAQTISFDPPAGGLVVGQPVKLGATSSAGLPISYTLVGGDATIKDGVLTALNTELVIVGASNAGNDGYHSAYKQVNFGNPRPAAQQAVVPGGHVDVAAEKPLTLTMSTTEHPVTYSVVDGPATMHGDTVVFSGTGNVTVKAATSLDGTNVTDETMTVAAHPVTRLVNISSRVRVDGRADAATLGFVLTGTVAKQILIRAVGESLAPFGVGDGLVSPTVTLYDSNRNVVATNSGWGDDAQIAAAGKAVGAFALLPGKTDAALLTTLDPGLYTARITSNSHGSVLLEVYDVASAEPVPTKQLINISTRAHLSASDRVVQGFVISGDQPKRVLVRAVGPTLKTFGVDDAIADPVIQLYAGSTVVASDDDWGAAATTSTGVTVGLPTDVANAAVAVGAFALPGGSKDAALLVTLPPGLYTAVVSGNGSQSGSVLVEAYEVP